jgi:hypothetical protein
MSIQRYRRKPERASREDQVAARYEPGGPLDDLLTVARMADRHAELAEAAFPSGAVLVVRYERFHDDQIEYETVEPGKYLACSSGEGFLYDSDDADWRQFYDLVPARPSDGRQVV